MPGRPSDATAHIQNPGWRVRATPLQHFVHKVKFGLLEVLFLVAAGPLLLCVVSQVDVLPPVVLQDAISAFIVCLTGNLMQQTFPAKTCRDALLGDMPMQVVALLPLYPM